VFESTLPLFNNLSAPTIHRLSRNLCQAVADLHQVNRLYGWCRFFLLLALLVSGAMVYWLSDQWYIALPGLMLLGLAESGLLIATHEALHGTLLAMPHWERFLSCLISWPMAWPAMTYRVLHLWHHRWNSLDCRDPERIAPCSRPWLRWAVAAGGVGLILSTVQQAWLLRQFDPRLSGRMVWDAVGICLLHAMIIIVAINQGVLGRYLLSWLIVERIVGCLLQTRALVEHWGLWQPRQNHLLSQLYGSRNVGACRWLNALMGGLPHHSAHHAFPGIPFHHLPQASTRIEQILVQSGLPPLPRCTGYLNAIRQLL
jgi:fatty acid desaturase